MTAKRDAQHNDRHVDRHSDRQGDRRSDKRGPEPQPSFVRTVPVEPPARRPVLLALSTLGVLGSTLFLVWMAWQS